jgi:hypothetical protein
MISRLALYSSCHIDIARGAEILKLLTFELQLCGLWSETCH